MRLRSFVPSFCSASAPTWWLVMHSPSGEMNDPEPPLLKRMEAFWSFSSHCFVGSNLCFFSCARGGLLNSHMPSWALAAGARARAAISASSGRRRHRSIQTLLVRENQTSDEYLGDGRRELLDSMLWRAEREPLRASRPTKRDPLGGRSGEDGLAIRPLRPRVA